MFSFGRRPAADESDGEGQPSATAEAAATDRSGSEGGEGEGSSDDGDSGSEESTEQGQGEGESTSEDSDDNPYTRLSPPLEITFHHEEDDEDYLDEDGLSESGDEDSRRPVSIQEFLAWRLLGRVPDAARSRNETRSRCGECHVGATAQLAGAVQRLPACVGVTDSGGRATVLLPRMHYVRPTKPHTQNR